MKNILIDKKFGHSSVARSIHKCFQIIFTACVCVCARMRVRATHVYLYWWRNMRVWDVCRKKKNMAVLPELHIKQHTIERHSLYLFLSQNINEERGQSTNKTHLEDSLHVLKKYQNLLEVRSQRNPRKRLSLACDLPTCIKMSACWLFWLVFSVIYGVQPLCLGVWPALAALTMPFLKCQLSHDSWLMLVTLLLTWKS